MKKNMGNSDRLIRLVFAIVLVVLAIQDVVRGTAGIILLVLAGILVLTSLFSFCPVYKLFGINSLGKKRRMPAQN